MIDDDMREKSHNSKQAFMLLDTIRNDGVKGQRYLSPTPSIGGRTYIGSANGNTTMSSLNPNVRFITILKHNRSNNLYIA